MSTMQAVELGLKIPHHAVKESFRKKVYRALDQARAESYELLGEIPPERPHGNRRFYGAESIVMRNTSGNCKECGCDFNEYSSGCSRCGARHAMRRKARRRKYGGYSVAAGQGKVEVETTGRENVQDARSTAAGELG